MASDPEARPARVWDDNLKRYVHAPPVADHEAPVTGERLRLFALAAMASKQEPGRMLTTVLSGQRLCRNEDEARGGFMAFVREARPDFSIDEILCAEVPAEMVLKAAAEAMR